MKTHATHPTSPDRTRCGRQVTDPDRISTDPDRIDCRRCTQSRSARPPDASADTDPRIGLLRYELEASLEAADWLTDADRAAVQLARHLADSLDRGHLDDDQVVRAARQLSTVYRSLGLTPDGRPDQPDPDLAASPLPELRSTSPLRLIDP